MTLRKGVERAHLGIGIIRSTQSRAKCTSNIAEQTSMQMNKYAHERSMHMDGDEWNHQACTDYMLGKC
jgi:hypothetical protein